MLSALVTPACAALPATTPSRPAALPAALPAGFAAFKSSCLAARRHVHQQRLQVPQASNRLFDDDDDDDDFDVEESEDFEVDESGARVEPYRHEWPNKLFIEETAEKFPDEGIADVEQGRALFSSLGYTYLDVRPQIENEDIGKVRGSVNIPIMNSKRQYDPEQKKKVTKKTPNEDFIKQVEERFKDKETKLLVGCSNGTQYSIDALEKLDQAGYTNIVGLKGGFYAWFNVFTNKLERRKAGEYAETYTHDGDSAGIHSSGAGFDRVDKADQWVPPEY